MIRNYMFNFFIPLYLSLLPSSIDAGCTTESNYKISLETRVYKFQNPGLYSVELWRLALITLNSMTVLSHVQNGDLLIKQPRIYMLHMICYNGSICAILTRSVGW